MEKKYSLKAMITLALCASALTCIIIYIVIGRGLGAFTPRLEEARRYSALLEKIEELYIGDYVSGEVTDEALRGAVYALGDEWSYYMSAEEYGEYISYSNNEFAGIGVEIEIGEDIDGMLVMSVYPDSPAARAGIVETDTITAVGGVPLRGLSYEEMSALMDAEIGEILELSVLHADGSDEILEVEYGYVYKDPVSYELLAGGVGYIALDNFEYSSSWGFIGAIKALMEEGAEAFVFDMRTNGGGKVSEMTYMLDYLLPEGEIFVEVDRFGRENIIYSDESWLDMPAVVLVNQYSYSAAEYFAVMLSEYGYAKTVGAPTTGKNRSQITVEMPDGGALHISSAEYLTKDRVSLHDTKGYTPDHVIAMTDDEYSMLYYGQLAPDDDPQLQKALELLLG